MKLKRKDVHSTINYLGKTYHFCCEGCEKEFKKDPSKYVRDKGERKSCH
ncbi:MAG TPA: YHS domain-containing protein [Thermotogae bacterium]|nr:YHS domain-containing protein [Thermotogota bacterium]